VNLYFFHYENIKIMKDKNLSPKNIYLLTFLSILLLWILGKCLIKFLLGGYIDSKIKDIVQEETRNLSTKKEKIQKLSEWFKKNIDYAQFNDTWFNFLRIPISICGIPNEVTFLIKKGRCEEWASLYLKLLEHANISGRIVSFVEDHALLEVQINNTWMPVEPPYGITSYEFYKSSRNISKAYRREGDKISDATRSYAETGFLVIKTTRQNIATPNVKTCIFSKYLMLSDPKNYKNPKLVICNYTNDFGIYVEELGEGIYNIEALKFSSPFECSVASAENYILFQNRLNEITLELEKENPLSCLAKFIWGN
jgi:hypothetical protein